MEVVFAVLCAAVVKCISLVIAECRRVVWCDNLFVVKLWSQTTPDSGPVEKAVVWPSLPVLMQKWKAGASVVLFEPKRSKCLSGVHKYLSSCLLHSLPPLACPLTEPWSTIEILLCLWNFCWWGKSAFVLPLQSHDIYFVRKKEVDWFDCTGNLCKTALHELSLLHFAYYLLYVCLFKTYQLQSHIVYLRMYLSPSVISRKHFLQNSCSSVAAWYSSGGSSVKNIYCGNIFFPHCKTFSLERQ